MSRIAAPMIGGMITAPLLSLFIIPAAYKLMWLHRHRYGNKSRIPRLTVWIVSCDDGH